SRPITGEVFGQAAERLILSRATHLDQLTDKLQEPRVHSVISAILAGEGDAASIPNDDIEYVRDLGLIALDKPYRIANKIYREVIPRELVSGTEGFIVQQTEWYVGADGRLQLSKLLAAFQQFFRENSEHWIERFQYKE